MNFPTAFENRVKNDSFLGNDLLTALNENPPVSLRLNSLKQIDQKQLSDLQFDKQIAWCENAFYLKERPIFTLDPLFHAGCYYPQEAGSMVLDKILRSLTLPDQPIVLDLCAAPGGKSTLISSFLNEKGLLVSNEVIRNRAQILKENLTKWGATNVVVTNNDPKDFERLPHFFDVVVCDAPCSGEGMFRKDFNSRNEWSESNVELCAGRQKRIVSDVWESLKPNGFFIYSTCTFNEQENEKNVQFICEQLGADLIKIELQPTLKKGRNEYGNYCLPNLVNTEGFFIAVLQKYDDSKAKTKFENKKEFKQVEAKTMGISDFTKEQNIQFFQWNDLILAFPQSSSQEILHLIAKLHIVKAGTTIGDLTRKGVNPHHELALNQHLCHYTQRLELTREQALGYLHGDTFSLDGTHGFQLITFKQQPLGWIKHLGNRFNNLYPKEWRIRMKID
ncbi:MAG: rRNA cytosine-C5-methyltransferase [Bacteroidota bacterium]